MFAEIAMSKAKPLLPEAECYITDKHTGQTNLSDLLEKCVRSVTEADICRNCQCTDQVRVCLHASDLVEVVSRLVRSSGPLPPLRRKRGRDEWHIAGQQFHGADILYVQKC